ncbi:hypothetical protein [Nocardia sp. XZ_19_231]|uniref:hypothetical protein n=1 Tax=Nocardia sp. XZ_19_231 TaxID=2769252 RepID=UPI00188DD1D7|nr:hypothetical protein [Nocardia sp. XZ_19_231]
MRSSLVLIEGNRVTEDDLRVSLGEAKQLVIGKAPDYGYVVHILAAPVDDTPSVSAAVLEAALRDLAAVPNVTGVLTLATRVTE